MYVVQVKVDESVTPAVVTLDPDKFHVRRDEIEYILFTMDEGSEANWDLEDLDFPSDSPITEMRINRKTFLVRDDNRRKLRAHNPLEEKHYKYTVTVTDGTNSPEADPEVVNE